MQVHSLLRTVTLTFLAFVATLAQADEVSAAKGVLKRLLGTRSREFELIQAPAKNGLDVYRVRASGGRVYVEGSSGVAMSRGAYDYLKKACHCLVTWEGSQLNLPRRLPDSSPTEVVCPQRYRHYFNVCTFGYTMVWWDWKRWEREIDWMALHGINMPLAMSGQEAVWQQVWHEYGLTDEDLGVLEAREQDRALRPLEGGGRNRPPKGYFTGPAFLPWHRMGNINSHMGPLPQSWLDGQVQLQRKILKRELELGMKPVTPAFSGFVPGEFARKRPSAQITRSAAWAGFEPTYLLSPRDPLFTEIGAKFLKTYRDVFGESAHLYLADVFNEMPPQFPQATKLRDLSDVGEAIYKSILAGDQQGTWVMQGWLFLNERDYWKGPEVEAFLKPVPNDRMIIIDLACEMMEVWRAHAAVREKQWIWCVLHNFGQNTSLFGNLQHYVDAWDKARSDPSRGQMVGMGITPEGIEQNSVVYELVTDLMWMRGGSPARLGGWLRNYVLCRYGETTPGMEQAWQELLTQVYSGGGAGVFYTRRPTLDNVGEPGPGLQESRHLAELFVKESSHFGRSDLFRRDLVDVMKRYLAKCAEARFYGAWTSKDAYSLETEALQGTLDDLDALLASRPEYRLSKWISDARGWGKTQEEKDLLEDNARMQVTLWGGPELHDYAAKEWSGLVKDFYEYRLTYFLSRYKRGRDPASYQRTIEKVELDRVNHRHPVAAMGPRTTIPFARSLLSSYGTTASREIDRGIAVGKPASDSGHSEPGGDPTHAVDGYASGPYWAASPYPQWWQIDLQASKNIGRIQVFPYRDGERYYQYTVDASLDAKVWTQIVDMSHNTKPATAAGDIHQVGPITARYVRVNMLYNSANVGVHLFEVRIFAAIK